MNRSFLRALPRLLWLLAAAPTIALATLVRFETSSGPIDLDLYDTQAPRTVANLLAYVDGGDYDRMFFHRLAKNADGSGFVLQGGGFRFPELTKITSRGTVQNEFSASRSNLRGTVAMAKVGNLPNSATSEWFVNLGNNSANLDTQNGGFTVFGRVTTPSMAVVDALTALQVVNANGQVYSTFGELPIRSLPTGGLLGEADLVYVPKARVLPTSAATDSDRVFNYLEAAFPGFIPIKGSFTSTGLGYYFRYYPETQSYVGTKDGQLHYLVPAVSSDIGSLGSLTDWLGVAKLHGY
jgi:cyclophilin family peptidyl-prolyl cis-trans isomerase